MVLDGDDENGLAEIVCLVRFEFKAVLIPILQTTAHATRLSVLLISNKNTSRFHAEIFNILNS